MNYASVDYLIGFLLSIFLVYSIVPAKARGPVLLGASFVFYWLYSGTLIFLLLAVSTVVYIAGLVLGDIRLMPAILWEKCVMTGRTPGVFEKRSMV